MGVCKCSTKHMQGYIIKYILSVSRCLYFRLDKTCGTMIRVLLVDFSKAFDRVDHHILLTKCATLGSPNVITKWLTYFLCQRKQRVKIGSVKSKFTTINAGVPQGTIFGQIGFVHHINDLRTTRDHVKYVDDCTIWESCAPSCVNS